MGIEDYRKTEKPVGYPGRIFLWGDLQVHCVMHDVSKRGAKLAVHDVGAVPDTFLLMLSPAGGVRRKCKVVARSIGEISVQFV